MRDDSNDGDPTTLYLHTSTNECHYRDWIPHTNGDGSTVIPSAQIVSINAVYSKPVFPLLQATGHRPLFSVKQTHIERRNLSS